MPRANRINKKKSKHKNKNRNRNKNKNKNKINNKNKNKKHAKNEKQNQNQNLNNNYKNNWTEGEEAIILDLALRTDLNGQRVTVVSDPGNTDRVTVSVPSSGEIVSVLPSKLIKHDQLPCFPKAKKKPRERRGEPDACELDEVKIVREQHLHPESEAMAEGGPRRLPKFEQLPAFKPNITEVWPVNATEAVHPLCWAFTCSMPAFARMALSNSLKNNSPAPLQWIYSLYHVMHHYTTSKVTLFQIEDDKETEAILLTIKCVRACPEGRGLARKDYVSPRSDKPIGSAPILLVEFLHQSKATLDPQSFKVIGNWIHSSKRGVVKVRAESASEVRYGSNVLRANQHLLSASDRRSKCKFFRRSVIFPPPLEQMNDALQAPRQMAKCAQCDTSKLKYEMTRCPSNGCNMVLYCNPACQQRHWMVHRKMHRKVGGKPASVSEPGAACMHVVDTAGANESDTNKNINRSVPSFTFDPAATNPDMPYNFAMSNRSGRTYTNFGGIGRGTTKIDEGDVVNIHGSRKFIVKLQPPTGYPSNNQKWLCYDKDRSFQVHISPDTNNKAWTLIQKGGICTPIPMLAFLGMKGWKGYFYAIWDVHKIRVFLDKLAPAQSW